MRKLMFLVILLSFLPWITEAQSLKRVKLEDTGIKIKVPTDFVQMIPDDIVQRFPSVRRPKAAYTDQHRQSELTVKISATQWGNKDQDIAKSFFKASVMELFDRVEFLRDEIITIKKNTYIILEFKSYSRGSETQPSERKYSQILYYIKNNKTLVVSFRCPESEMALRKPMADEIISTIKIKNF